MIVAGEVRQLSRRCHVPGCGAASQTVVVYSARRSKDPTTCQRWAAALGLSEDRPAVHACQRHFPAGAPTRNNPDPNPKLFNPIPKQNTSHINQENKPTKVSTTPIFNHSIDGIVLGPSGKPLPPAVRPPPGSVTKLSANATLIDLGKIRKDRDPEKPFRIEEVTVMIDEKDTVKVVDYGPKETVSFDQSPNKHGRAKKWLTNTKYLDEGIATDGLEDVGIEPTFHQFSDGSLSNTLEQMRQLRIDCNTALVDVDKRHIVYAHRAVLVARSPYFYRQMYLRRKKLKYLYQFCRFTLPVNINFDAVEAVISYMYTGSIDKLSGKGVRAMRKVLTLFEMQETLDLYEQEIAINEIKEEELRQMKKFIKREPEDVLENLVIPLLSDVKDIKSNNNSSNTRSTSMVELINEDRRKRRRTTATVDPDGVAPTEDVHGKMKVSVQKIVDNALTPFMGKIEELFDPSANTLQIARTSQHIITLWHADILLTKLFDQNDLTKFFSEVMNEILEKSMFKQQSPKSSPTDTADVC